MFLNERSRKPRVLHWDGRPPSKVSLFLKGTTFLISLKKLESYIIKLIVRPLTKIIEWEMTESPKVNKTLSEVTK